MNAGSLLMVSSDKPESSVARLASIKHKRRQRQTFALAWRNKGQIETRIFSSVTQTGRRDRLAGMKFGNNSIKTRQSALHLAFRKPKAEDESQ